MDGGRVDYYESVAESGFTFDAPKAVAEKAQGPLADAVQKVLDEKIKADPFLTQGRLIALPDRVILSFPGPLLFEAAAARLRQDALQALFNLGGILRLVDNQVGVLGRAVDIDEVVVEARVDVALVSCLAFQIPLDVMGVTSSCSPE